MSETDKDKQPTLDEAAEAVCPSDGPKAPAKKKAAPKKKAPAKKKEPEVEIKYYAPGQDPDYVNLNLYQRIAGVMNEVSTIAKTGYNSFHHYYYATEEDVLETLRPLFIKYGLILMITVDSVEVGRKLGEGGEIADGDLRRVALRFSIRSIDNPEEKGESVFWGEGQDKGDKGFYKAYTGAMKYWLLKTFMVSTGDDPELDTRTKAPPAKDDQGGGPPGPSGEQSGPPGATRERTPGGASRKAYGYASGILERLGWDMEQLKIYLENNHGLDGVEKVEKPLESLVDADLMNKIIDDLLDLEKEKVKTERAKLEAEAQEAERQAENGGYDG